MGYMSEKLCNNLLLYFIHHLSSKHLFNSFNFSIIEIINDVLYYSISISAKYVYFVERFIFQVRQARTAPPGSQKYSFITSSTLKGVCFGVQSTQTQKFFLKELSHSAFRCSSAIVVYRNPPPPQPFFECTKIALSPCFLKVQVI